MRVAIVHDDLVQWGGAERVLEGICEIYPDAPIFSSVFDKDNKDLKKRFGNKKVYTSFLQRIPGWKSLYKAMLPLYPIAFEQFDFSEYDLVISHTTRFAKSIITKPKTVHICYCHTPPRFLWNFSGQSYPMLEFFFKKLKPYDKISAQRVDYFIAGSENAKRRIKKVYGNDSKVVYPFVDLKRFENIETFDGGYYLVISRLNKYKRIDLALEACIKLELPLKIIGIGPESEGLRVKGKGERVEFLRELDDEMLVQIMAGCRALIIPGIEDFGMTSLEVQALGKPVIAYKEGGVLETVQEGKTGFFFDYPTVDSLIKTLDFFNDLHRWNNAKICQENAKRFSKDLFFTNFKQTVEHLLYTN
ncbi:MAG: glycosyltransferase [Candidatus Daviesbacteria bacterium]|nr:glycosyltransferase [Candidatus Daviesbacteria bacterium]